MAKKETMAERLARQAAEDEVNFQALRDTFPQRLLKALAYFLSEVTEYYMTTTYCEDGHGYSTFHFKINYSDEVEVPVTLSADRDTASQTLLNLQRVEDFIVNHKWKAKEAERIENIRRVALMKLTDEEKSALGL